MRISLTILMPVRDAAATLRQALRSLSEETTPDLEILVIDDGSRDETPRILREHGEREPRLRVRRQPRSGLVAALQHGLEEARGEFVGRHDADDLSVAGRFADQVEYLRRHPEVTLVATRCELFRDAGELGSGMIRWMNWTNGLTTHDAMYRERFVEAPFAHPSVVFRADSVREAGGYRDGDFPEDYELWLRLFESGHRMARLDRLGVRVREHDDRSIHRHERYRPDAFRSLKIEYLRRGLLRTGGPVLILGGGRIAKRWVPALHEAGVEVAGLVDIDPARQGKTIRGVRVYSPPEVSAGTPLARIPGLGAVGKDGAREIIRSHLPALGRVEGENFLFVA